MFCLGQQVGSNQSRVRRPVGDQQRLRWSVQPLDAHVAVDQLFGQGHKQAPRADHLVHPENAFGAVGQGGDRLCPSQQKNSLQAGHVGRCQDDRRARSRRTRWGSNDDLLHASHLGRDDSHQQGRGIGCRASRHIDPHSLQRAHSLAQCAAFLVPFQPRLVWLPLVEGADPIRRQVQRLAQLLRLGKVGRLQRPGIGRQAANLYPVDAPCIVAQRCVAVATDIGDDPGHRLLGQKIPAKNLSQPSRHALWQIPRR